MLTPEEQREFMRSAKEVFVPAAGAWGRQGWTRIRLADADRARGEERRDRGVGEHGEDAAATIAEDEEIRESSRARL